MRKYDVQELLRQQKNSIRERVLTILLGVVLGICATGIFEETKGIITLTLSMIFKFVALLLLFPLIWVFKNRDDLIKIKEEVFTAVICLDMEKDPKPIQFADYPFSVETESYWNSLMKNNEEMIEKFKTDHKKNNNPFLNYQKYFDYQVITDLLQYIILKNISSRISKKPSQIQLLGIPENNVIKLFFNLTDNFRKNKTIRYILNNINFINRYYEKKERLTILCLFSNGIPTIFLPSQIQNNLFVSILHKKQLEHEKEIYYEGKHNCDFTTYLPFVLSLPNNVSIEFEDSNNSQLKKIILTQQRVGRLTIEFHDRWRHISQKTFIQTQMRPGNLYHHFEEIFFEITIDLHIKKYAYFPLIGGGEKDTDDFFSWANELIEKLKKNCDWNYYQENITRDVLDEIKNKLDYHDWESKIEFYSNFDDTQEGEIERLLRLLLSPNFKVRIEALKKIENNKDKIQSNQIEIVILRILKLAHSPDKSTRFLATKTLSYFSAEIPSQLHKRVVEELLNIADNGDNFTIVQALSNLGKLFNYVNDTNLKERIQDKVIQVYTSNTEYLSLLQHERIIKDVYPNIDDICRFEFEEKFLQILKYQNKEALDSAFMFFISVKEFISEERLKQIFDITSKIDICEFSPQSIENYLIFLKYITNGISAKSLDAIMQNSIQKHYKIIISLIQNNNCEIKMLCIKKLSILSSFINLLSTDQKEVIYTKLKLFLYTSDKDTKFSSLETICYVADCFPGREEDIATIIIKNVDPQHAENYFQYIAMDGLNKIESGIVNESLSKEVSRFQEIVKNL